MGCSFQDLFNIARSLLVQFPSSFFSICFVSVYVVQLYCSIDTTTAWKKFRINLWDRPDFHMTNNQSIEVNTFTMPILMSLSIDETLLPRYVNLSTNFRELSFRVEMSPWLKYMTRFSPHSRGVLCLLLPYPGYASGIWLLSVFARSAVASVLDMVSAGYRFLLAVFRVKLFSFTRSIYVLSM